jgi:phage baseplate assembly protein W
MDHGGDTRACRWRAGVIAGQPVHLRANRNATQRRRHTSESKGDVMNIDYPFDFAGSGRTASTDDNDHIRDLIEQLLFTSPGERVNRPDFGSGLLKMVFAPNSESLASTLQGAVQAAIQRWLGDLIELKNLEVKAEDSTLSLTLSYLVRRTNEIKTSEISRTV